MTEIIPPIVKTNLGRHGGQAGGVELDPFADSVYQTFSPGKRKSDTSTPTPSPI